MCGFTKRTLPAGSSCINRFSQPSPDRMVSDFPDACFLRLTGAFITSFLWDHQGGHHHL